MAPSSSDDDAPASAAGFISAIDAIVALQQERAMTYRRLDEGFRSYVQSLEEGPYQALLRETTAEFKNLSNRIRTVETALQGSLQRPDAADIVRSIQEHERDKLYYTVAIQSMRGSVAGRRFSWQREAGPDGKGEAAATCGSCVLKPCRHGDVPEPTEYDVNQVTKEAYQHLETCVRDINDSILELVELKRDVLQVSLKGQASPASGSTPTELIA